jgi:ABC-2 type transport system permease protein
VTYVLDGLRSLITDGWEWGTLGKGLLAILILASISFSMASATMRGRISQN